VATVIKIAKGLIIAGTAGILVLALLVMLAMMWLDGLQIG
jgi:hypothetical protein